MPPPPSPTPPVLHQTEEIRVPEVELEQSKHVTVEEAPAAPAQASVLPPGVPNEELAAIKIQTAFRGYLINMTEHASKCLLVATLKTDLRSMKQQCQHFHKWRSEL